MSYGRWDRDRFERAGGGRETIERERFDERDYYGRGAEVDIREDEYRRTYAPSRERSRPPAVRESERVFFEERPTSGALAPYRRPREEARFYDERETVVDRERDMVPYRERREDDREVDISFRRESRPFQRPQFVRRQSSLDTHDRRPLPRYGDRIREREDVYVPAPPRRRSPPRFVERDFYEDIRVAEPDYYNDEDYHPYRERERETVRRRYPPPPPQGEEVVYEREEVIKSEYPKRGKTRMPKRIINIRALIELGYEYEEEEKTIIILKALGKENIDEVIRISKKYNSTPMPPPPMDQPVPPPDDVEVTTRRTEIIRDNPSLPSSSSSSRSSSPGAASTTTRKTSKTHKSSKSRHSRHTSRTHRSKSTRRRHRSASFSSMHSGRELVIREPRRDMPHSTALILPRDDQVSSLSLEEQLRALELERKALQLEREAKRDRYNNYTVEKDYKDGTVEIKRDQKGPNPNLLKAMMATLT